MDYAYVFDNNVEEIFSGGLPYAWKNYSNFNLIDRLVLPSIGVYEIADADQPDFSYDPRTHKVEFTYAFKGDCVERTKVKVSIGEPDFVELKDQFIAGLRSYRNSKLIMSDWTQMPDIAEVKGQAFVDAWKVYRQQLRDIMPLYETNDVTNLEEVVWPQEP